MTTFVLMHGSYQGGWIGSGKILVDQAAIRSHEVAPSRSSRTAARTTATR